ncbi:VOC family protein [Williamsia deligens]|uniref:VOC family protein n=1 Tax=Williamsia deligens TaxID=321325 RepID=A0ABW3G516_9NOCA|nr:VOC family protein [Williamsia deligens]MCP2194086.1 putative conserved protein PhnB, glyoxalase superfamily [Williamsia deligens]
MTVTLAFTHLTVHDVDAALSFYRDALGLTVHNDVSGGGGRWVTIASDAQPGVAIVLSTPQSGRGADDAAALEDLLAKGSLPMIGLSTNDLDGLFDRVVASGAEVLQEPMDQPWGPRDCAFRDPSGTTVRISAASTV